MIPDLRPDCVYLVFMKGKAFLSKWIQFKNYSKWSHVEGVRNGVAIGARMDGVKPRPLAEAMNGYSHVKFLRIDCTPEQADEIWRKLVSQIGKKFDITGLLGILLHNRNWQDDDSWWCSELQAWACHGVFDLFRSDNLLWVTPEDLYQSMRLVDDGR